MSTVAHNFWLGVSNCEGKLEPELMASNKDMPDEYVYSHSPETESILPGQPREVLARLGYEGDE